MKLRITSGQAFEQLSHDTIQWDNMYPMSCGRTAWCKLKELYSVT